MTMRLREISLQAKHTAERKRAESILLSDFQNKKQYCMLHCQKIAMENHTEDGKLNYSGTKIFSMFFGKDSPLAITSLTTGYLTDSGYI